MELLKLISNFFFIIILGLGAWIYVDSHDTDIPKGSHIKMSLYQQTLCSSKSINSNLPKFR